MRRSSPAGRLLPSVIFFSCLALNAAIQTSAPPATASAQAGAPDDAPGQPNVVVLPQKIVAGEIATLTVLDAQGRLVSSAAVRIAGGNAIATDATGRATFRAPAQPGTLSVQLQDGAAFTTAVVPAQPAASQPSGAVADASPLVVPHMIAQGDRFTLRGASFQGDAQLDRIQLGDQNAFVLAASPVELVALPNPHTPLGAAQLSLRVAGVRMAEWPVTVISLSVNGPATAMAAGEKGMLTIAVNGTTRRVVVEVRNLSPEVVTLSRATVVTVTTRGGERNTAALDLTGVKPGDYSVSAHIVAEAEAAGAP